MSSLIYAIVAGVLFGIYFHSVTLGAGIFCVAMAAAPFHPRCFKN